VAEFKVLTANYQAEYGRSSGAQISVVSKSGGTRLPRFGRLVQAPRQPERDELGQQPRRPAEEPPALDDVGYTVGGPIFVPDKFNSTRSKLFFFWSQEFQKQLKRTR